MNDYYAVLGVLPSASAGEIKKAYRQAVFKWHPDRNPDPQAEQRLVEINAAYQAVSAGGFRSTTSGFGGVDFSDFFTGRSTNNRRDTRTRTQDAPQEPYLYNGLLWEPRAYRGENEDKELLYFDQSLDRLQKVGYERPPRPAEAMSFLADGLEGKLSPKEKEIFDNMLTSYGEWLSAAVQVIQRGSSQILEVYLDPEGLVWNGSKYIPQNFKSGDKKEYDITGIPLEQYVDLNRFPNTFVVDMYSRPFAELPQDMREGTRRAQIILPATGQMRPVGRSNFGNRFIIDDFIGYGASRGVRVVGAKKIST